MFNLRENTRYLAVAATVAMAGVVPATARAAVPTASIITGEIQSITVADKNNPWSRGVISVAGVNVIIPANLIIQMPVQRYTVQELFTSTTKACKAAVQTGLARGDSCFAGQRGAIATINANRQVTGEVIAGMVKIDKDPAFLTGVVTYLNYDDGYFRLNGKPNDKDTGVMVRINDPTMRHTIQRGLGCNTANGGANCSPDKRFAVDNENYTVAFMTGVPICIPSTVKIPGKHDWNVDANGFGDGNCPKWSRQPDPIVDTIPDPYAYYFVPIVLGESLDALGCFETVVDDDGRKVKFYSAHTIRAHSRIMTKAGNPDYMTFNMVEWDMAGYSNQRARLRIIGFTSLTDSQLDLYALHTDNANVAHEFPLASTVGNPLTISAGAVPFGGSIFKIIFDVDFVVGVKAKTSPCINLANAGFVGGDVMTGGCPSGPTVDVAENFSVLAPVTRDIIAHTRNQFINSIGPSKDILGNDAPNGQYLSPVEVTPPDPLETNVNGVQNSFVFSGVPWLLDRRLGPLGCGKVTGDCRSTNVMLNPFPYGGNFHPGKDPSNPPAASVPASVVNEILSFVSGNPAQFLPGNVLAYPTIASTATAVTDTVWSTPKVCTVDP